jgi:hypothetical protein
VRVLCHDAPRCQRQRPNPGRARRRLLHFDLEQPRFRIDGLDRAREHDSAAVQEPGTEDERGRLAAHRVEHHAFDDADPRPVGTHAEALGIREPVLEHVAPPAEHIRPHIGSVGIWVESETRLQRMPSVLALPTASVLEPAPSLRRIALTW